MDTLLEASLQLDRFDVGVVAQFLFHPLSYFSDADFHVWVRTNTPRIIWTPWTASWVPTSVITSFFLLLKFVDFNGTIFLDKLFRLHVATADANEQAFVDESDHNLPCAKLIAPRLDPFHWYIHLSWVDILSKTFINNITFIRLVELGGTNRRYLILQICIHLSYFHLSLINFLHLSIHAPDTLSELATDIDHVVSVIRYLIDTVGIHLETLYFNLNISLRVILQSTSF